MIQVDERFASDTVAREGSAGRVWLEALPSVVNRLCEEWSLSVDGEPMYGYLAIVLPVRRGNEPCVLKVSWMDDESADESLALSVWNGNGAVRLLDHNKVQGALLLERLDPAKTLESVPIDQAVPIAAGLLRRLSVPAPTGFRTLAQVASRWQRELVDEWTGHDRLLPRRLVDAAVDICGQCGPASAAFLVNTDLHYGNVLGGTRAPWLVIDPKPVLGDAEFAVAPLLWNRFGEYNGSAAIHRRLEAIVESAGLDFGRARRWAFARMVDNRLWSLRVGLTEDAERFRFIAIALMDDRPSGSALI